MRLARKGGLAGLDRSAVERHLFDLATTVENRPGRWTTDLALAGPHETWRDALAVALRRLSAPVLGVDEAQAEIDDLLLRRKQARSSRTHHIRALSAWATRGPESVYLRRMKEAELRALAESGPHTVTRDLQRGAVLALVTGPVSPEELMDALGVARESFPDTSPLDFVRPPRDRILLLHHPSQQAQVTVHSPQYGYRPDDYGPRRLWAETMGGPAGLVFSEVREKRGMAYSAHAGITNGWRRGDANHAWLRVGTEAGKAAAKTAGREEAQGAR